MASQTVFETAKAILPQPLISLARAALVVMSPSRRQAGAQRQAAAGQARTFVQKISPPGEVLSGPFAGLRLAADGTWSSLAPCAVGSYEDELHATVEALIESEPQLIVDVGAADGYYAVGLARRLPQARVVAFELEDISRRACMQVARANGVSERMTIRRAATARRLERALVPGALLVMDCEGAEDFLLAPDHVPTLRSCTILVELHDFDANGLPARVAERFAHSHRVEVIQSRPKVGSAYEHVLPHLTPSERDRAVDEHRSLVVWATMLPNHQPQLSQSGE